MDNKSGKYNVQIDIYKLIFAIVIFLYHSHKFLAEDEIILFDKGYLAVEFFFIVSGYFFADSIMKNRTEPTVNYILRKISLILPYYITAFIIAFLLRQVVVRATPTEIVKNFFLGLGEAGFLQMFGIKTLRIYNGVTWYISSMFIAMGLLHPIAKKYWDYYSTIGAFFISMAGYAIICQENQTLGIADKWFGGVMYLGNIRAMAGISLGVVCYSCCKKINSKGFELTIYGKIMCSILKIFILLMLYCILNCSAKYDLEYYFDYVAIGLFFAIVALSMIDFARMAVPSYKKGKVASILSLLIYLNHRAIIYMINSFAISHSARQKMSMYVIGTFATSLLCFLGGGY